MAMSPLAVGFHAHADQGMTVYKALQRHEWASRIQPEFELIPTWLL